MKLGFRLQTSLLFELVCAKQTFLPCLESLDYFKHLYLAFKYLSIDIRNSVVHKLALHYDR